MAVNLWGPSDLNVLVNAMRTFIPHSSVVHTHSFGEESLGSPSGSIRRSADSNMAPEGGTLMLLEDEVVKISAVLLQACFPEPARTILEAIEGSQLPNVQELEDGSSKGLYSQGFSTEVSAPKSEGSSLLFAEPWELGFENDVPSDQSGNPKRSRVDPSVVSKARVADKFHKAGKESPNRGKYTREPREVAVVYICELPEIIGKFDPEKAKAKGLRPGPKYGQLQAGKSVISDDGKTTVHPSDVMDPSSPGPICLVVDCPTTFHVSSLISASALKKFSSQASTGVDRAGLKKVTCMIHIGPASVTNCSKYREWMGQFEGTQHVMAGHGMSTNVAPILKSSARVMTRLNFICPQVFPVAGLQQNKDVMDSCQDDLLTTGSITMAENLLKFRLRPISATPFDRSLVPEPLDMSSVLVEMLAENPELRQVSKEIAELWTARPSQAKDSSRPLVSHKLQSNNAHSTELAAEVAGRECMELIADCSSFSHGGETGGVDGGMGEELPDCLKGAGREEMEIVFLGTGSSQPSKYRNVSSIYIHLFKRGGLLLDCGEGTYAQLKRRYGNQAADEIVAGLKCVWISHIHADHHTGLARILAVRKEMLENQGKSEPILVVGPKQLKRYLDAYEGLEDLGMEFLDCSQTTTDADGEARLIKNGQVTLAESSGTFQKASRGLVRLGSQGKGLDVDGQGFSSQLRNYWLQSGFNFQSGLDKQGREKLKNTLSALGLSQLISVPVVHCPHAFGVVLVARGKKLLQPGWKLVYSGDTRPCQSLVDASKGATVLIHEATFDDAMPEEAIAKNHSLTREAIETGITAGVYRTILTHFSQRYPKIPVFNESYNARTCIAFDMMSANLADLPLLPKLLPALKLLFKDDMMLVDEEDFGDQS